MNQVEFDKILINSLTHVRETLVAKSKGYSAGGDKLHNFKVAARVQGVSTAKALEGMRIKHDVSIMDMVNNPDTVTEDMIVEKIGDRMCYDVLLSAIFLDHIRIKQNKGHTSSKPTPKVTRIEDLVGGNLNKEV